MMPEVRPLRLQRKRTKGFRLVSPNGLPVVYVSRPSKWGNPFRVDTNTRYAKRIQPPDGYWVASAQDAVEKFERYLRENSLLRATLDELRGCNLACWCAIDAPWCHADVLLRLANAQR